MINKEELIDIIENTKMERVPESEDTYEKRMYLDEDIVLIVGYSKEKDLEDINTEEEDEEELVFNFYWFWELRNSQTWDLLFENKEKNFNFCASAVGRWSDYDKVEDVIGDIAEVDVCKWSDQDKIKDISENIAEEVLSWLKSMNM